MMRILFIAIAVVFVSTQTVAGDKTPGRFGVYASFENEIGSPYELRKSMREIKAAGIDFIISRGKGSRGNVWWDSQIASEGLVSSREYLGRVIKYARAEGLKIYPVFCVCLEGGEDGTNELLDRNPSWAYVYWGNRTGYIDAGNADARRYQIDLMAEVAAKYDIDGISLDFLRFPNKVSGYTETGRAHLLKKHNVDLAKITSGISEDLDTEGGKAAQLQRKLSLREHATWPEWKQWKRDQINQFMKEIRAEVRKVKPGLPISSYVWGARTYIHSDRYEIGQDWKTWIEKGWLDWINPSGYRYTDEEFMETAKANRALVPKGFPFYITIGVKTSHGRLNSADEIKRQIAMSKEAGADGIVFFTWDALRPYAADVAESIKDWKK